MTREDAARERDAVRVRMPHWSGLRHPDFDADHLTQAVASHEGEPMDVLKDDARSRVTVVGAGDSTVVVKEVRKGGPRRRLADAFRGSPARRAFHAGRALRRAGIGAARPLAFVEQARAGIPARSLLVSTDLRAFPTAAAEAASDPERAVNLLCDLVLRLHEHRFVHGDLRAQHVHLCGSGQLPSLIDLEGVHTVRSLSDTQRMEALAQVNASLPDDVVPAALRAAAYARYAAALPFATTDARERIVDMSRARKHLWQGRDCP